MRVDPPGHASAPAPDDLTRRRSRLSPAQLRALERRLRGEPERGRERTRIPARAEDGPLPLSYAQQRFWFLEQLSPGDPANHVASLLRLEGPLDPRALHEGLQQIVQRHEALRTVFVEEGGEPVQRVLREVSLALPTSELDVGAGGLEAALRPLAQRELAAPFDLTRGPLLRARLFRVAAGDHVLSLVFHHIAIDGESLGVLLRELAALYTARLHGAPDPLPPLPIQYPDFAIWQRRWLEGERLEAQLAYWKRQLARLPELLQLPVDRPRSPAQRRTGATHPLRLSRDTLEVARAAARREDVSLFMFLLAAFYVLLHRYTGQTDLPVGTPIANRHHDGLDGVIGFFANTLVLRGELAEAMSFRALVQRVRETALSAYAHQDVPFEQVVDAVQPRRAAGQNPLFQVLFAVQGSLEEARLGDISVRPILDLDEGAAPFDLTLLLYEAPDGLIGSLEYATELFDRATAARLADHYARIVEQVARDPEIAIRDIALLDAGEQQWLRDVATSADRYPVELCFHDLFEAEAARGPDRIAVVLGESALTYREVDDRAEQLAGKLRELGVGPEVTVGVCLERSLEMAPAIIGVLKAGGAGVMLEPSYPRERLAYMIRDSRAPVMLTQRHLLPRLPEGVRTICLEDVEAEAEAVATAAVPGASPRARISPDHLAFVLYTSGSTGEPKGVAVTHRGLAAVLRWMSKTYGITPSDCELLKGALGFPPTLFELFLPLSLGARVVMADPERGHDPHHLRELIARHGVTMMEIVPSLLDLLLEGPPEACRSLRHIFAGGDSLPVEVARRCTERWSWAQLSNILGSNETSTAIAWWSCDRDVDGRPNVPVGRPIANVCAYVLDENLAPVPVGVIGELYVSGPVLARGYLGRPDLTAEKFIPDPFSTEPGARLFRTGDLGRVLPDGSLEHLGRADRQVKIRGVRIEPGEIEAVLCRHPLIQSAVVVAWDDGGAQGRYLAAYLVARSVRPTDGQLRQFLRERIVEAVLPSLFVWLDALPVSAHGKLDRRALPRVSPSQLEDRPYVAPRTPEEQRMAQIWASVLGGIRVGVTDDFFEIGGHSLRATQILSRVRSELGVDVPVRAIFDAPTVASLARVVESIRRRGAAARYPALRPVARQGAAPLSAVQLEVWEAMRQAAADPASFHVPLHLMIRGPLDVPALERALGDLIARQEVLRSTFSDAGGEPAQVVRPPDTFLLALRDLSYLPERERAEARDRLLAEDARRPFDLAIEPPLRVALVLLAEDEHLLMMSTHRIAFDAACIAVLGRELASRYEAHRAGDAGDPPALPIQIADYAAWERSAFTAEALDAAAAFWRRSLEGVPATVAIGPGQPGGPSDNDAPARREAGAETEALPRELARAITELGAAAGTSAYVVLLAAFELAVARRAGADVFAVWIPVANRASVAAEQIFGRFAHSVPLRADVTGTPTFAALCGRVREAVLDAQAHQEIPLSRLRRHEGAGGGAWPATQIVFNLVGQGDERWDVASLRVDPIAPIAAPEARLTTDVDLLLYADVQPDGEIALRLVHREAVLDRAEARSLLDEVRAVLESAAGPPSTCALPFEDKP